MVHVDYVVQPDPAAVPLYNEPYKRYCALYGALKGAGVGLPLPPVLQEADSSAAVLQSLSEACTVQPGDESAPSALPKDAESSPCAVQVQAQPQPRPLIIAPSILAADFADLGTAIKQCMHVPPSTHPTAQSSSATYDTPSSSSTMPWLHVDMFDGSYCPNWTLGPPVLAALRGRAPRGALWLDCHLAVQAPGRWVEAVAAAGADSITFHWEACTGACDTDSSYVMNTRGTSGTTHTGSGDECTNTNEQQTLAAVAPESSAVASGQAQAEQQQLARARALAARVRGLGCCVGLALAPDTALCAGLVELVNGGAVDMVSMGPGRCIPGMCGTCAHVWRVPMCGTYPCVARDVPSHVRACVWALAYLPRVAPARQDTPPAHAHTRVCPRHHSWH